MNHVYHYQPNAIIQLTLDTEQEIHVQNASRPADEIILKLPVNYARAYMAGRWLLECTTKHIFIREINHNVPSSQLLISCSSQAGQASVRCNDSQLYETVTGFLCAEIHSGESGIIKMTSSAPEVQVSREIPADTSQIEQLQNALNSRIEDLTQEEQRNLIAVSASSEHFFQALNTVREQRQNEESRLQNAEQQMQEEENRLEQIRHQLAELETRRNAVQSELSELTAQEEFTSLDCESAQHEIDGLRQRLHLDSDTLRILEDDRILTKGCVSGTLKEVKDKLEAAEARIGMIIRYRMAFNQTVDSAILSGDGTITSEQETGGFANGNGTTTPATDS